MSKVATPRSALVAAALLLSPQAVADAPRLSAGYYGDIASHPGGFAGASWKLAEAGDFELSLGGELGAYHHHRNHTGVFTRAVLVNRIGGTGAFFEPRFSAGYLHTFLDADGIWMVDDDGRAFPKTTGGSPNLLWGMGLGGGWQSEGALGFVVRGEVLGRTPYNGYAHDQFSLMVGVEWQLGGGAR